MHHSQLLLDLQTSFDDLELRQLCASLGIQYEALPGFGRGEKIQQLIARLDGEGRLEDLGGALVAARPHLARYYQQDNLSWLDEIGSSMPVSLEELPTLNWPTSSANHRAAAAADADARGQLLGQLPTLQWPNSAGSAAAAQTATGANPYLAETIVKDPGMFFGRRGELVQMFAGVQRGRGWLITGLKGIGKSSLLFQFAHYPPQPLPEKLLVAYIDLADPGCRSRQAIHNAALRQWYSRLIDAPPPTAEDSADFARQVRTLHSAGFRVLLCLESPDQLLSGRKFGPELLPDWVGMARQGRLILVTAADPGTAAALSGDPAGSELAALLRPLPLGLLDRDAAESLLIAPSASRGVLVLAQAVTDGLRYCGRHPQFLQLMGCVLFDSVTQGGYDRAQCQTAFQLMAGVYWSELWEQLSPAQRHSLSAPISRGAPLVLSRHYHALADLGLLAAHGQELHHFSRGFELWISEQGG